MEARVSTCDLLTVKDSASYLIGLYLAIILDHENLAVFLSCETIHRFRSAYASSAVRGHYPPGRPKASIPGRSVCLISPTCVLSSMQLQLVPAPHISRNPRYLLVQLPRRHSLFKLLHLLRIGPSLLRPRPHANHSI